MMRRFFILILLIAASGAARADYVPTRIEWNGWSISSSEDLYAGRIHTSYPLTYLVDDDPTTAWVFSGKGHCKDGGWNSRYALEIRADKPVRMDRIALMNGYNKSHDLFAKNSRVVEVRVTVNQQYRKTAALSDRMGWHFVAIPRQSVRTVRIEFTKLVKGPADDVCISGLELHDRGRKITMHVPRAVMYSEGSDCGDGSNGSLTTLQGRSLAHDDAEEGGMAAWSPNGRFVASAQKVGGGYRIWVADARLGRIIFHRELVGGEMSMEPQWKGDRHLAVTIWMGNKSRSVIYAVGKSS